MSARTVRVGVVAGIVGGVVMATFAMLAMWLNGTGFWAPLNLVAHGFVTSAPLDGTFSVTGMIVGLVVHMIVSMVLGVALAALLVAFPALRRSGLSAAATGTLLLLAVWVLVQYAIWPAIDADAAEAFTPWVFAVGHAMFGVVAVLVARPGLTAPPE